MAADAPERIVLPDDATREDIAEALGHASRSARRSPYVVEKYTTDPLYEWGRHHAWIDMLLNRMDQAPE